MKISGLCLLIIAMLSLSCTDALEISEVDNLGDNNHLTISTITTHKSTKALIEDDYLPATSAIGITVLNTEGSAYDNIDYQNIRFEAEGTGATQKWQGEETIYLSATEGYCYGYYPYSLTANDITQIPVSTASQTDYLYATPKQVDINNKNVNLNMKHALSAIRLALKRGTYTGTGKITAVSVTSTGLGTTGTLNATTGKVTASGTGTAIAVTTDIDLTTTEQNADIIVVPTSNEANLTLTATIDGKDYTTPASAINIEQGKCYTYTVTINAGELALSGIKVGDWGYDDGGAPTIEAAGYKVTLTGNYEGVAFSNAISEEGTVTIKAIALDHFNVPAAVTCSENCTVSQSTYYSTRTIKLSAITSDIIVTFNGLIEPPAAIADDWDDLANGVYVVRPDLRPANAADGNEACIGVGLVDAVTGQRLMIEKYEYINESYKQSFISCGATGTDYTRFYWGVYGSTVNDLLGITDYIPYAQVNSSYSAGVIPNQNGNYLTNADRLGFPSEWPTDDTQYALADNAGYLHSQYLMQVTATDEYMEVPKMAQLLKTFLASSDALGYRDWYVPSLRQFAAMYSFRYDIDDATWAIRGTKIDTPIYWTSSEQNANYGYVFDSSCGQLAPYTKNRKQSVRLVRNL